MIKKIRFALEMGDETSVRTIEELRAHYNSEKIVSYFLDGKLLTWLNDRYYTDEAQRVEALAADTDRNTLAVELANIFDVHIENDVDVVTIAERNERLNKLREYTSDDAILNNIEYVAFSQEELGDILDEGAKTIYLCGDKFRIPLSVRGKRYIGVNDPIIDISTNTPINLKDYDITVSNCTFSERAKANMFDCTMLINEGLRRQKLGDYANAVPLLKRAAESGDPEGQFLYAKLYDKGLGVAADLSVAEKWYRKSAENGNAKACNNLGNILDNAKKYKEAFEWYEKAVGLGDCMPAVYNLGRAYASPDYGKRDYKQAEYWLKIAAESGSSAAMAELTGLYADADHSTFDKKKALFWLEKWREKAATVTDMMSVGDCYFSRYEQIRDLEQAIICYQKAAEIFNADKSKKKDTAVYAALLIRQGMCLCGMSAQDKNGGYIVRARRRESEAVALYEDALKISPTCGADKLIKALYDNDVTVLERDEVEDGMVLNEYGFTVIIPEGTSIIGHSAFYSSGRSSQDNAYNLKFIKLPKSVRTIEDYAFSGSGLIEINIPEGVRKIGDCAFSGCENLRRVTFPSTLREIGESAFEYCNLEPITLPRQVRIQDDSFYDAFAHSDEELRAKGMKNINYKY